ncbi:MAG: CARDB domain-containing protein [Angustibacter sp.]
MFHSRSNRTAGSALTGLIAVALCVTGAGNATAAGRAGGGKPTPAPAGSQPVHPAPNADDGPTKGISQPPSRAQASQASRADCSLRRAGRHPIHDEWRSCVRVDATLDRAPAVGQTARLTVTVRTDLPSEDLTTTITLPGALRWVTAPTGFRSRGSAKAPELAGGTAYASRASLKRGDVHRITGVVRAVRTGRSQISVSALNQAKDLGDADSIPLTVATAASGSRMSHPAAAAGTAHGTTKVPAGTVPQRSTKRAFRSVGTSGLAGAGQPGAPCDTTVAGSWSYADQSGVFRPSANVQVQVWDDNIFGDSRLATGVTDGAGNYSLCFDANETGVFESGTADVYVSFVSENSIWKVQRGGSPLTFSTGITANVARGGTLNLGSLTSGDATLQRGLHAFDAANDAWLFVPKPTNLCFDQSDSSCRQLVINWAPDSTDGTYYSLGGNDVHLAADDPNAPITVVHEIGHAVMDDVYDDAYPATPNCNPHSILGTSSAGCAWTEGWAEWFPATVYNDPFYRWPSGASLDLENLGWTDGGNQGDTTEGRIAGALIDITDSANEGPWDTYSEGSAALWATFTGHVSNTLADFWNQRAADGFAVSDPVLGALHQNTIDYGFRDLLSDYAEKRRPTPVPAHHYGYATTTGYWSVVAIRPNPAADYDLQLYDDRGLGTFLRGSSFGGATVDFVAVDSNRRALGDYYPRINQFAGTGDYDIELAQGSAVAPFGTSTLTMGSRDVVTVRDVFLTAGSTTRFRVQPSNSGQDAEVFLMGSNSADPGSWTPARSQAVGLSTTAGAGGAEQFDYTAPVSQWYGVVVVNKAGSGPYSLGIDQSAPSGSVVVNGGAATTTSRTVSLALAASDTQTGVPQMRVATDGAMDSEPWTAFAASRIVSLPGGNGVKTVLAQFRNGLGLDSAVVSDTITLSMADLVVSRTSNPPPTVRRENTFPAQDVTRNAGTLTAPATTTRYLLSLNTTRDTGDVVLTGRTVPALAPGTSSVGPSRTVTVPRTTAPGSYYLIACADYPNGVPEVTERNNCRASTTRVRVTS